MKKQILGTLFLMGILLFPMSAKALTVNATLSCDKSKLNAGESTTCTFKGTTSDGKISNLSAQIEVSSNLEFVSFTTDSAWQGTGDEGKILLYTDVDKEGTVNFGTFIVKAKAGITNSDETISITQIKFYDADYQEVNNNNLSHNIRIPSTVNNLSTLTVSGATLSFNPNTTTYNVTIDSDKTTITATKADEHSTISGDIGTKTLNYGVNTFKVTVTSETGVSKVYTINITRPDNRSKNNNLKSLRIKDYDLNFAKNKTTYTITVPYSVTAIDTYWELDDEKASLDIKYSDGLKIDQELLKELMEQLSSGKLKAEDFYYPIKTLKVGENTITITVTAENETTQTYTIKIMRQNEKGELPVEKVEVDDTASNIPTYVWVIGSILVILGIVVVIFIIKENKKEKNQKEVNHDEEENK